MKTLMLAVATAAVVSAGAATDVKVEFWRDDVVRILKIPEGGKAPEKSYVVTAKPEMVAVAKSEKDGAATYSSAKLRVTVDAEGRVAFAAADGTPLLAEEGTTFTPRAKGDPDENSFSVRQGRNGRRSSTDASSRAEGGLPRTSRLTRFRSTRRRARSSRWVLSCSMSTR